MLPLRKRKASPRTSPSAKLARTTTGVHVAIDTHNIYVARGGKLRSSDVGSPLLFATQNIKGLVSTRNSKYLLDDSQQLWRDGAKLAERVTAINDHYALDYQGRVARFGAQGNLEPFPTTVTIRQLVGDLLLGKDDCLYDSQDRYIVGNVRSAATDGDDISILYHDGRLDFLTANDACRPVLQALLTAVLTESIVKAVPHAGSLLVLTANGEIIMSGANTYFESGTAASTVNRLERIAVPRKAIDFDFRCGVGWALLDDDSVWVWGDNEGGKRFLQWYDEFMITPRLLTL